MAVVIRYVNPAFATNVTGSSTVPYNQQETAITASTEAETIVRLRRGHIYKANGSAQAVFRVASKSPAGFMRVEDWGDEEMPPTAFGGLQLPAGTTGWEYRGGGIWRLPLLYAASGTTAKGFRLFIGARITGTPTNKSLGTGYTFDRAVARCPTNWDADEATILPWMNTQSNAGRRLWAHTLPGGTGTTAYLYVYTGSAAADPSTYYEGLLLPATNLTYTAGGFGVGSGLSIFDSSNIELANLDTIFAPQGIGVKANSLACSNNRVTNCNAYAYGLAGLKLNGTATGTLSRTIVQGSVIAARATEAEDWGVDGDDYGLTDEWLHGGQDAVNIGEYTDDCGLYRVRSYDGLHGNFTFGPQQSSTAGHNANSRFVDCYASNANVSYGAALGGNLTAGGVAYIERFVGEDVVYFISRAGGGKFLISDSAFRNAKRPYPQYVGYGGINSAPALAVYSLPTFGATDVGAITMTRCTLMQPYGFMMEIQSASGIPDGAINITDSLLVDTRYLNDPAARSLGSSGSIPGTSIIVRNTSKPQIVMTNSYYYTGSAGGNIVCVSPVTPVYMALASYPGVASAIEADPVVDDQGRPRLDSPLKYAGIHTGYTYDADGRLRNNPPSIGAYEYVEPRASRL